MKLDKKSIIVIVSLIIISLVVSFNFEKFTGNYTYGQLSSKHSEVIPSNIYVSNDLNIQKKANPKFNTGDKIFINIDVGSEGCERIVEVYKKETGTKIKELKLNQNCAGNKCRARKTTWTELKIPGGWKSGEYCATIHDLNINANSKHEACFKVN